MLCSNSAVEADRGIARPWRDASYDCDVHNFDLGVFSIFRQVNFTSDVLSVSSAPRSFCSLVSRLEPEECPAHLADASACVPLRHSKSLLSLSAFERKAGQRFSITVLANEAAVPFAQGTDDVLANAPNTAAHAGSFHDDGHGSLFFAQI